MERRIIESKVLEPRTGAPGQASERRAIGSRSAVAVAGGGPPSPCLLRRARRALLSMLLFVVG